MVVINSSLVYSDVGTAIDIDVVMKSLLYYLFHSCNSRPRVRGNSGRDRKDITDASSRTSRQLHSL